MGSARECAGNGPYRRAAASGRATPAGAKRIRSYINSAEVSGSARIFHMATKGVQQQQQMSGGRGRTSARQPAGGSSIPCKRKYTENVQLAADANPSHPKRQRHVTNPSSAVEAASSGQETCDLRAHVECLKSERRTSQSGEQSAQQQQHTQHERKSATALPVCGPNSPGILHQHNQNPSLHMVQTAGAVGPVEVVNQAAHAVPRETSSAANNVRAPAGKPDDAAKDRISSKRALCPAPQHTLAVAREQHSHPKPAVACRNSADSRDESLTNFEGVRACEVAGISQVVGDHRITRAESQQHQVDAIKAAEVTAGTAPADASTDNKPVHSITQAEDVVLKPPPSPAAAAAALPVLAVPAPSGHAIAYPAVVQASVALEQQPRQVIYSLPPDEGSSDDDEHVGGIIFKRNSQAKARQDSADETARQRRHCKSVYAKRLSDSIDEGVSKKRLVSSMGDKGQPTVKVLDATPSHQHQTGQDSQVLSSKPHQQKPAQQRQSSQAQAAVINKASSTGSTGSCRATAATPAATTAAAAPPRKRRGSSAAPGADDDADSVDLPAAVAAAGILVLPAGKAVLRNSAGDTSVDPQEYHLGDKLPGRKGVKLFIQVQQPAGQSVLMSDTNVQSVMRQDCLEYNLLSSCLALRSCYACAAMPSTC